MTEEIGGQGKSKTSDDESACSDNASQGEGTVDTKAGSISKNSQGSPSQVPAAVETVAQNAGDQVLNGADSTNGDGAKAAAQAAAQKNAQPTQDAPSTDLKKNAQASINALKSSLEKGPPFVLRLDLLSALNTNMVSYLNLFQNQEVPALGLLNSAWDAFNDLKIKFTDVSQGREISIRQLISDFDADKSQQVENKLPDGQQKAILDPLNQMQNLLQQGVEANSTGPDQSIAAANPDQPPRVEDGRRLTADYPESSVDFKVIYKATIGLSRNDPVDFSLIPVPANQQENQESTDVKAKESTDEKAKESTDEKAKNLSPKEARLIQLLSSEQDLARSKEDDLFRELNPLINHYIDFERNLQRAQQACQVLEQTSNFSVSRDQYADLKGAIVLATAKLRESKHVASLSVLALRRFTSLNVGNKAFGANEWFQASENGAVALRALNRMRRDSYQAGYLSETALRFALPKLVEEGGRGFTTKKFGYQSERVDADSNVSGNLGEDDNSDDGTGDNNNTVVITGGPLAGNADPKNSNDLKNDDSTQVISQEVNDNDTDDDTEETSSEAGSDADDDTEKTSSEEGDGNLSFSAQQSGTPDEESSQVDLVQPTLDVKRDELISESDFDALRDQFDETHRGQNIHRTNGNLGGETIFRDQQTLVPTLSETLLGVLPRAGASMIRALIPEKWKQGWITDDAMLSHLSHLAGSLMGAEHNLVQNRSLQASERPINEVLKGNPLFDAERKSNLQRAAHCFGDLLDDRMEKNHNNPAIAFEGRTKDYKTEQSRYYAQQLLLLKLYTAGARVVEEAHVRGKKLDEISSDTRRGMLVRIAKSSLSSKTPIDSRAGRVESPVFKQLIHVVEAGRLAAKNKLKSWSPLKVCSMADAVNQATLMLCALDEAQLRHPKNRALVNHLIDHVQLLEEETRNTPSSKVTIRSAGHQFSSPSVETIILLKRFKTEVLEGRVSRNQDNKQMQRYNRASDKAKRFLGQRIFGPHTSSPLATRGRLSDVQRDNILAQESTGLYEDVRNRSTRGEGGLSVLKDPMQNSFFANQALFDRIHSRAFGRLPDKLEKKRDLMIETGEMGSDWFYRLAHTRFSHYDGTSVELCRAEKVNSAAQSLWGASQALWFEHNCTGKRDHKSMNGLRFINADFSDEALKVDLNDYNLNAGDLLTRRQIPGVFACFDRFILAGDSRFAPLANETETNNVADATVLNVLRHFEDMNNPSWGMAAREVTALLKGDARNYLYRIESLLKVREPVVKLTKLVALDGSEETMGWIESLKTVDLSNPNDRSAGPSDDPIQQPESPIKATIDSMKTLVEKERPHLGQETQDKFVEKLKKYYDQFFNDPIGKNSNKLYNYMSDNWPWFKAIPQNGSPSRSGADLVVRIASEISQVQSLQLVHDLVLKTLYLAYYGHSQMPEQPADRPVALLSRPAAAGVGSKENSNSPTNTSTGKTGLTDPVETVS